MDSRQKRFTRLVLALSPDIYRFAYSLCKNKHKAEDLTQQVCLRAWKYFDSLRDEKKVKSWLFTTVRREFAREFEKIRPIIEDDVNFETIQGEDTDQAEIIHLRKSLAKLPLMYREPLLLQVVGGFTGIEISSILNIPPATVNTRLFRARHKLRSIYEDNTVNYMEKDSSL